MWSAQAAALGSRHVRAGGRAGGRCGWRGTPARSAGWTLVDPILRHAAVAFVVGGGGCAGTAPTPRTPPPTRQFARQLLAKGNRVHATARSPASASRLADLATKSGGGLTVSALDVADPASITAWAAGLAGQAKTLDVRVKGGGGGGWRGVGECGAVGGQARLPPRPAPPVAGLHNPPLPPTLPAASPARHQQRGRGRLGRRGVRHRPRHGGHVPSQRRRPAARDPGPAEGRAARQRVDRGQHDQQGGGRGVGWAGVDGRGRGGGGEGPSPADAATPLAPPTPLPKPSDGVVRRQHQWGHLPLPRLQGKNGHGKGAAWAAWACGLAGGAVALARRPGPRVVAARPNSDARGGAMRPRPASGLARLALPRRGGRAPPTAHPPPARLPHPRRPTRPRSTSSPSPWPSTWPPAASRPPCCTRGGCAPT